MPRTTHYDVPSRKTQSAPDSAEGMPGPAGGVLARAAILCGAMILIAAIWAAAFFSIQTHRRVELAAAATTTANLARAFEEHVIRSLDAIDQALLRIKRECERIGRPVSNEALAAEHRAQADLIGAIAIADASGDIVAHSLPFPPTNVAGVPHFQALAARDTMRAEIGPPSRARVTGLWSFPVVRRVNKPDGSFGGVVHASLRVSYFEAFYRELDLGADGVIALDGRDGVRRAGIGRGNATANAQIGDLPARIDGGEPHGSHVLASPGDGVRRVISYRALEHYPLIVLVGIAEDEALVRAARFARNYYAGAAAFTAFISLMGLLLVRKSERQQRVAAALAASEQRHRELFNLHPSPLWVYDVATHAFVAVNEAATDQYGYSHEEFAGLTLFDLFPSVDHAALRERLAQRSPLALTQREVRQRRKDGTEFLAEVRSTGIRLGDRLCRLVMSIDITERKRAEAALRESDARARRILDTMFAFVGLMTPDGILVEVNRAALEASGQDRDDVIGHPVTEISLLAQSPDGQIQVLDALRRAAAGEIVRREVVVCFAGGQMTTLDTVFCPLRDAAGRVVQIVGSSVDITERKRAERLLAGQKDLLQAIASGRPLADSLDAICRFVQSEAEGMLCSILLLDDDGVHLRHGAAPSLPESYVRAIDGESIGPRAGSCGTAAFRREQVIVEDIATDPLWADYRASALPHGLRACWSTPIVGGDEHVLGTFAMYYGAPCVPQPEHRRLIEVATRTTSIAIQHHRAAEILRESESRLRLATQASNVGLWDWDIAGNRVYYSPEWKNQLGYRDEELPSRYGEWETRLHPDDAKSALATLKAYLAGATPNYEQEFRLRHKDGSYRAIYSRAKLIRDGAGNPQRMLGCHIDITERKRAEAALRANEQLRAAAERAQAADRLKSAFLATMSHELRTPLNSIIGFTGILLQELAGPLNPEQRKQLTMVRDSARHLLALINDVLDISKIEAGELRVSCVPFDLRASLMKVAGIVKPLAEAKGLTLHVQLAPELGAVAADARRVEQVLLNLLHNAIKFTVSGEVTLTAEATATAVRMHVADTGIGIKRQDLGTLFQPFRQIDAGLARTHEGTGLGLAICRRLAHLMGGEISVTSEWQKGSTFSFTLPSKVPVPS